MNGGGVWGSPDQSWISLVCGASNLRRSHELLCRGFSLCCLGSRRFRRRCSYIWWFCKEGSAVKDARGGSSWVWLVGEVLNGWAGFGRCVVESVGRLIGCEGLVGSGFGDRRWSLCALVAWKPWKWCSVEGISGFGDRVFSGGVFLSLQLSMFVVDGVSLWWFVFGGCSRDGLNWWLLWKYTKYVCVFAGVLGCYRGDDSVLTRGLLMMMVMKIG